MDESYYLELVLREVESVITKSEKEALDAWLAESDSHGRKAEQMKSLWLSDPEGPEMPLLDHAGDYEKVMEKIRAKTQIRLLYRVLSVAASVLIIASTVFYLVIPGSKSNHALTLTGPVTGQYLPDGSKIWLSAGTTLRYTAEDQRRHVELDGRVYFEVTPDPNMPFIVSTKVGTVEVLGTSFEVSSGKDSLLVQVTSGMVQVKAANETISLGPGSSAVATERAIRTDSIHNPVAAWRLSPIVFEGASLREVMDTIRKYYPLEYLVESEKLWDCRLNFTLHYPPAEELNLLLETLLEVQIDQGPESSYIIHGEGCF